MCVGCVGCMDEWLCLRGVQTPTYIRKYTIHTHTLNQIKCFIFWFFHCSYFLLQPRNYSPSIWFCGASWRSYRALSKRTQGCRSKPYLNLPFFKCVLGHILYPASPHAEAVIMSCIHEHPQNDQIIQWSHINFNLFNILIKIAWRHGFCEILARNYSSGTAAPGAKIAWRYPMVTKVTVRQNVCTLIVEISTFQIKLCNNVFWYRTCDFSLLQ